MKQRKDFTGSTKGGGPPLLRFKLLLAALMLFSNTVSGQSEPSSFVNPDFYFDFSQIKSSGTQSFVVDQVTKNPNNAFTFQSARMSACPGTGHIPPTVGPDGVVFHRDRQGIRLQHADNINLGPRWMTAFWIKSYHGVPSPRNETLLTQARYDNRNETPHAFSIGLMSNPSAMGKLGLRFAGFLYNPDTEKYQFVEAYYQNRLDIIDGWYLIVVSLDAVSVPTQTTVTFKMRGSNSGSKETTSFNFPGLTWLQRQQDKQDIYLGAFCDLFQNTLPKVYGSPFRGTISRLWIWRNILDAGIMIDTFLDKYFFRVINPNNNPSCVEATITEPTDLTLPCRFCIVGFNPPTDPAATVPLYCMSEDKTYKQMFIAFWNFDEKTSDIRKQSIEDKSGNGYVLYRGSPTDSEPNEPFKLPMQGYLFEKDMFAQSALPILLHNFPGFTIDVWVRREANPNALNNMGTRAFGFFIDRIVSGNQFIDFGFEISDVNNRIILTVNNRPQQSAQYNSILKDNTWQYFAASIYRYTYGAAGTIRGCRLRFQANNENVGAGAAVNCLAGYDDFTVPATDKMWLVSSRSFIFNRLRIFQHAMSAEELPAMIKTTCAKKMGQAQCNICAEDSKCITVCDQDEYENPTDEACTRCHDFCGGCFTPDVPPLNLSPLDACTFCTRDSNLPVEYSVIHGNCTCKSGLYFNATSVSCEPCHARCKECFGPLHTECLTCAGSMIFYPPTFCVESCDDVLVKGDGKYGYFKAMEPVGGTTDKFAMCIKCHPYCTKCDGTLVSECSECQSGFFLQGSTCIDNCPDNMFPDMINKRCSDCAKECLKCTTPLNTTCTKCNKGPNPQTGVLNQITMKLQTGSCKYQCDAGFWSDGDNVCQPCHIACSTCTTQRNTTCGSCTSGYFLEWLGFACKFDCDDGKYGDTATNMCLLCHYSCLTCRGAGPDQCKVCAKGFLRRRSLCVSKCEEGEFIVDGACFSCDRKCLTCYGPKDDQCYTCAENTQTGLGFYYYDFKCMMECPGGFYPDNFEKSCKPCKTVCSSCISWDFCTACIEGPYQLNNGECTFFQCMESQYRAVKPTLACYDCDPSCLTCQGMSRFDCVTCRPAHKFYENTCLTCKDQPGMTEHPDPNYPGCIEICGDGFNFGMVECDDGNLMNGDGCTSKCFIEKGWNCTGGSPYMPDTCRDIQSPTPKISLINKRNQVYISFDEEVILTEDLNQQPPKFTITVTGNQPFYKFDWEVPPYIMPGEHLQSMVINLDFGMSLRGTEKLTLRFLSAGTFQDLAGNGIVLVPLPGQLSKFKYLDPFWSNFLDGIADYMTFSMGAIAVGNIVSSQVWGVSTTSLWTTLAYLQMITLVPLLSVNWPNFVTTFFGRLGKAVNGETSVIPNLIFDKGIAPPGTKTVIEAALNDRYKDYYHEYSNFFYLAGRKIFLWGAVFGTYPFIWYLKRNYADKHKFCKLWEKLELRFRYSLILRGLLLSYVSGVLASTLNIYNMQFTNLQTLISCFVSITFQIGMIYLPILFMNILQQNYDKLDKPKFVTAFYPIIDELDLSHPSKYMYYSVFLMRRVIYVFLLVLFTASPLPAVIAHSSVSLLMIIYVLVAKPFKRKVTAFLTILGEIFVAGLHMIGLGIIDPDQPDDENTQFGFFIVGMLALFLIACLISIVYQVLSDLVAECKARSQKTKEALAKEEDEFRYKKWKKRRQLVKREHALKERQKLLDQHEDLVEQYQKQIELEEERRQREEEEKERLENGEEPMGDPYGGDLTRGWQNENSAYMMNGYDQMMYMQQQQQQQMMMGGYGAHQWMSPDRFAQQQQQQFYDPRFEDGPDSAQRMNEPSSKRLQQKAEEAASRNAQSIQLNKNSGGSDEALNKPGSGSGGNSGDKGYGDEYGYEYGDYGPEQQEPAQKEKPPKSTKNEPAPPTDEIPEPPKRQVSELLKHQPSENEVAIDEGVNVDQADLDLPDFDDEGLDAVAEPVVDQKKKKKNDDDMWN